MEELKNLMNKELFLNKNDKELENAIGLLDDLIDLDIITKIIAKELENKYDSKNIVVDFNMTRNNLARFSPVLIDYFFEQHNLLRNGEVKVNFYQKQKSLESKCNRCSTKTFAGVDKTLSNDKMPYRRRMDFFENKYNEKLPVFDEALICDENTKKIFFPLSCVDYYSFYFFEGYKFLPDIFIETMRATFLSQNEKKGMEKCIQMIVKRLVTIGEHLYLSQNYFEELYAGMEDYKSAFERLVIGQIWFLRTLDMDFDSLDAELGWGQLSLINQILLMDSPLKLMSSFYEDKDKDLLKSISYHIRKSDLKSKMFLSKEFLIMLLYSYNDNSFISANIDTLLNVLNTYVADKYSKILSDLSRFKKDSSGKHKNMINDLFEHFIEKNNLLNGDYTSKFLEKCVFSPLIGLADQFNSDLNYHIDNSIILDFQRFIKPLNPVKRLPSITYLMRQIIK